MMCEAVRPPSRTGTGDPDILSAAPDDQSQDAVIVLPSASIADAIARLDRAGTGALVLCSPDRRLVGLLTNGDVRRAILEGRSLTDPCGSIAVDRPIVASSALPQSQALRLMNQAGIDHLPVIDQDGCFCSLILRKDLVTAVQLEADLAERLDRIIVTRTASIAEAMAQLDRAGTGALVVCDEDHAVYGVLTDGDIRRAVLRHVPLSARCDSIATHDPVTAHAPISAAEALALMNARDINHLPVLDESGNLERLILRKDLVAEEPEELPAVIMAGGFGRRLMPLTEQTPKPMLPVGDRPLLEHTIAQLRKCGIRDISITTHYRAEAISQYFGDGVAFGVRLSYFSEESPLGTAGGLAATRPSAGPVLVINGDILTGVSLQDMLKHHRRCRAEITVGVRKYDVPVPFGVVECQDTRVIGIREKPSLSVLINAGIYLVEPSACASIPRGRRFDMTDLIQLLLDEGRAVVSFPVIEYWLDVGRPDDYAKAQRDVASRGTEPSMTGPQRTGLRDSTANLPEAER